jgi:hypothetical protein
MEALAQDIFLNRSFGGDQGNTCPQRYDDGYGCHLIRTVVDIKRPRGDNDYLTEGSSAGSDQTPTVSLGLSSRLVFRAGLLTTRK